MKKRKLSVAFILGAVLILASLSMMILLQIGFYFGSAKSLEITEKLNELLPERSEGVFEDSQNPNMPVLELDGQDYVALVEISSMDVALPVADSWDSNKLFTSPARFFGSAYDGSLVIGGADIFRQFSFCDSIENGDSVTVTDMTGAQFNYRVEKVERSKSAESQWLISPDHDLTLFCRDMYSMEYIAVRCIASYK